MPLLLIGIVLIPLGTGSAVAAGALSPTGHSVGLFDPAGGTWYLRDHLGRTTRVDSFGALGDVPLMGDWDGDGVDTPGLYQPDEGRLIVRNDAAAISFIYRMATDALPVVADTDGDGRDTVSLARQGRLYIIDGLGRGPEALEGPDPLPLTLPGGTQVLVGGDFDGDGVDEIAAVHDGEVEVLGRPAGTVIADIGTALPVAGDWDGDGVETLGGYDEWRAQFRLYGADGEPVSIPLYYGSTGMLPVSGVFGALPGGDESPEYHPGLPALRSGDEGPAVAMLQEELARRHLYRGEIDGKFGPATAYAVMAFHKVLEVERTWTWEEGDSLRMTGFRLPALPDRPDEPNRVEVDVGRQVLYLFEDGRVTAIVPISTGGGYLYYSIRSGGYVRARTPHGDFRLTRHTRGWTCDSVTGWCIYSAWNFTPSYALHGYREVPAYPASHGCVRIPTWESDLLERRLFIGMPFHVWDTYSPPGE